VIVDKDIIVNSK